MEAATTTPRQRRLGVDADHRHYKWWALSCTSLGMLLATINSGTLIIALPDLERALEFATAHEEAQLEDGVRLVHRALADALGKEGLAEIATDGKFDPHTQEALLSQPSEAEEGTVIQVLQKGYLLGDRVLRPARVVISAGSTVA